MILRSECASFKPPSSIDTDFFFPGKRGSLTAKLLPGLFIVESELSCCRPTPHYGWLAAPPERLQLHNSAEDLRPDFRRLEIRSR